MGRRKPYRYRRCLHCLEVFPASAFTVLRYGPGHWRARGYSLRECPECGLVAQTRYFPVVDPGEQGSVMLLGDDDALLEDEEGRWVA